MTTLRIDTKTKPAKELLSFLRSLSFVQVLEDKDVDRDFNEETIEAIRQFESGESVVCEGFEDYLKKIRDV